MIPLDVIGEGDPVPSVALADHEGNRWHFEQHRGRQIVLILHRHLA